MVRPSEVIIIIIQIFQLFTTFEKPNQAALSSTPICRQERPQVFFGYAPLTADLVSREVLALDQTSNTLRVDSEVIGDILDGAENGEVVGLGVLSRHGVVHGGRRIDRSWMTGPPGSGTPGPPLERGCERVLPGLGKPGSACPVQGRCY